MILFKPEHVQPILTGEKTETRRIWKRCRVRVDALHWAQTRMFDPASRFARLRIIDRWEEALEELSLQGARAEGYSGIAEYLIAFARINKIKVDDIPMYRLLWVVRFEVAQP